MNKDKVTEKDVIEYYDERNLLLFRYLEYLWSSDLSVKEKLSIVKDVNNYLREKLNYE